MSIRPIYISFALIALLANLFLVGCNKKNQTVLLIPSMGLELQLGAIDKQKIRLDKFTCYPIAESSKTCRLQSVKDGSTFTVDLTIQGESISQINVAAFGEGSGFVEELFSVVEKLDFYKEIVTKKRDQFNELEKYNKIIDGESITLTFTTRVKTRKQQMASIYLTKV